MDKERAAAASSTAAAPSSSFSFISITTNTIALPPVTAAGAVQTIKIVYL